MTLHSLRRLARMERGAALVEFAMVLPVILVMFAAIMEGGRLMWSYQSAVTGVRDAARYLGRIVPADVCPNAMPDHQATLTEIVNRSIQEGGILRPGVRLDASLGNPVTATLACVAGAYRISPAPVATVTARVRIDLPFQAIFNFTPIDIPEFIVTTITDRSRVFGS